MFIALSRVRAYISTLSSGDTPAPGSYKISELTGNLPSLAIGDGIRLRLARIQLPDSGILRIAFNRSDGTYYCMTLSYSVDYNFNGGGASVKVISANKLMGDSGQGFEYVALYQDSGAIYIDLIVATGGFNLAGPYGCVIDWTRATNVCTPLEPAIATGGSELARTAIIDGVYDYIDQQIDQVYADLATGLYSNTDTGGGIKTASSIQANYTGTGFDKDVVGVPFQIANGNDSRLNKVGTYEIFCSFNDRDGGTRANIEVGGVIKSSVFMASAQGSVVMATHIKTTTAQEAVRVVFNGATKAFQYSNWVIRYRPDTSQSLATRNRQDQLVKNAYTLVGGRESWSEDKRPRTYESGVHYGAPNMVRNVYGESGTSSDIERLMVDAPGLYIIETSLGHDDGAQIELFAGDEKIGQLNGAYTHKGNDPVEIRTKLSGLRTLTYSAARISIKRYLTEAVT